jgi:hypothetical protein
MLENVAGRNIRNYNYCYLEVAVENYLGLKNTGGKTEKNSNRWHNIL